MDKFMRDENGVYILDSDGSYMLLNKKGIEALNRNGDGLATVFAQAPLPQAPMTPEEQKSFLAATGEYIRETVDKAVAERMREFGYKGVHENGVRYMHGNFVTKSGSLWACLADTNRVPGETSDWQLCVKRGQNGKDGQDATQRLPTGIPARRIG